MFRVMHEARPEVVPVLATSGLFVYRPVISRPRSHSMKRHLIAAVVVILSGGIVPGAAAAGEFVTNGLLRSFAASHEAQKKPGKEG